MNLEKLTENIFDDKNLSDTNLRFFTDDHLLRLSLAANNPGGIYSPLITDTTTKYNAFFGRMTDAATKKAISEGLTITMEATKKAAIDFISDLRNLVIFKFRENSATYQEFYPQGMTEYHNANLPELPMLLQRYLTAATTHLNGSNPAEVTELTTKIDAFNAARTAQLTTFAEVENLQTGRREDRTALTLQLTTNILTIALNNLLNPDNFNNYYNPSYLPQSDSTLSVSGTIAALATEVAINEGIITASSIVTVYNQGPHDLVFSLFNQGGDINPNSQITVMGGNHATYPGPLPVFDRYYLNIQNPHPNANGKWKVTVR